jgi:predicted membrane chloride channel (bestrophin family)
LLDGRYSRSASIRRLGDSAGGKSFRGGLFLAVISFIVILLLRLIDDIDNPFGLSDANLAENVSIELLEKAVERLRAGAK